MTKLELHVKTELIKRSMTQRALARELGIHHVQLNAVLKGRRDDRHATELIWNWLRAIWTEEME